MGTEDTSLIFWSNPSELLYLRTVFLSKTGSRQSSLTGPQLPVSLVVLPSQMVSQVMHPIHMEPSNKIAIDKLQGFQ